MVNFKLKSLNSDFKVREVSFLPSLKDKLASCYTYLLIQKEGLTTFDLIERLKSFFQLNFSDLSCQGLKDEDGITEQLISVKKILGLDDVTKFNSSLINREEKAKIVNIIGYGDEAVQPGFLHGNIFSTTIRNLEKEQTEKIEVWCLNNKYFSFVNYYDSQRFGTPESRYNTNLIGKAVIDNDWKKVYEEFLKSGNSKVEILKLKKSFKRSKIFKKAIIETLNPQKISFFISSYNSFLWNQRASTTILSYPNSKTVGFDHIGKLAIFTKNEFICQNNLSITGFDYNKEKQETYEKIKKRVLIVSTSLFISDISADELNKGKVKARISFFLPCGSYATMAIKQLFLLVFPDETTF